MKTNSVNENKYGRYQTWKLTKNLDNGKKLDCDNKLDNDYKIRQWQQSWKGTPNWTMTTDLDKGKQGSLKCRLIFDHACMRAIAYTTADRKRNNACESLVTWWVASQNVAVTHVIRKK